MREIRTVLSLAMRDYFHEWQMSSCFVLALAAILAPMLVLFGLKFGIVNSMAERLIQDPLNREIRPVGSGRFDQQWFDAFANHEGVAFIMPRTRTLAAVISLRNTGQVPSQILKVELIPTGPKDPMLHKGARVPARLTEIILSASAARKLNVGPGDKVDGSLARIFRGQPERVHTPLTVVDVAKAEAFGRDGAFVPLGLMLAIEDFLDGRAVPQLGWDGLEATEDAITFAGFRMYARSIDDVTRLQEALLRQGVEVRTKSRDIELVQSLDRNLAILFWVIALVALVGFSLSLGASLWANVDRKRRELSVMRMVGFRTSGITSFPVIQALLTGVLGWLLAAIIYIGIERGLNQAFSSKISFGESICRLLPEHFLGALILTLCSCVFASALGGYQAARIEPSEGVREV